MRCFAYGVIAVAFVVSGMARAVATEAVFDPGAGGFAGSGFTADTLVLQDNAQITFGNGGLSFADAGLMPVAGFLDGGIPVAAPGYGSGWGLYVRYSGTGTQAYSAQGFPTVATFDALQFSLVGYAGMAVFGFDPSGAATVGGALSDVTVLAQGGLVGGALGFVPTAAGPTIEGEVSTTLDVLAPGVLQTGATGLTLAFTHPPGDYGFGPAGLEIAGQTPATAAFDPAPGAAVPEPGSLALWAGSMVLAWGARRFRGW